MSFIAGYLTGLSSSQGSTLYDRILALPDSTVFNVTDRYILTVKYDTGSFINAPAVQASGIVTGGGPLAYISREYLTRPVIWLCLYKDSLSEPIMLNYAGYFSYNGWGHSKEYSYDSDAGIYLSAEYTPVGSPAAVYSYQQGQGSIGILNILCTHSWEYTSTSYSPDGTHTQQTLSESLTLVQSLPNALSNGMTALSAADIRSRLYEFAAECEEKRREL